MKKIKQLFAYKRKQTEIEQFYNENYDYYYRLAYNILGNYSDAEDAVSAAFLKIKQKNKKFFKKHVSITVRRQKSTVRRR